MPARTDKKQRKLSFKETGELATLPDEIDQRERARDALYMSLSDLEFTRDGAAMIAAKARIAELEREIVAATQRWEELEMIAGGHA